ncbi:hypothetical protein ACN6MY_21955 [Peribacillus sp. B-H-3]|jgi:hypothetical protein|uniref:hypothetical protein n=1 Tax=Peribacillus sp. B-H-3 TaxID=3400420 RepID=UPI003B011109
MDKISLFKNMQNASGGNFFSVEIPKSTLEDGSKIKAMAKELESEGKIKLREYIEKEDSVYLHGIMKYASD